MDELPAALAATADITVLDLRLRDGAAPATTISRLRAASGRGLVVSGPPAAPAPPSPRPAAPVSG